MNGAAPVVTITELMIATTGALIYLTSVKSSCDRADTAPTKSVALISVSAAN